GRSLTKEQQQARALVLSMLETVRDESSKEEAIRSVFEPKSNRIDRHEFAEMLLAQTSMEANYSINLVCIDTQGRPKQTPLRGMLEDWLDFRRETVRRRRQFRLDKTNERIHVLEGRMVVYLDVDAVIHTIRDADAPKEALIERFALSERQAEDILEMRLRQLARLEGFKIEQELKKQRTEAQRLERLLNSEAAFKKLIIKEIEDDAAQFGDARRTLIQEAEKATLETKVPDEPVTVIVSKKGWLRRRQGHGVEQQSLSFKTGDSLYAVFECRSQDELIALGADGRVYTVDVASIPSGRGDGQPITAMVEVNPKAPIVHMIAATAQQAYLFSLKSGYGFIARLGDLSSRQRA